MSFVVDGSEWRFEGKEAEEVVSVIEHFLARIETARMRAEVVWIGDDFQTRDMIDGLDLWSLYSSESPLLLPTELWQEITAWLFSAKRYADEPVWPPDFDVVVVGIGGEQPSDNVDVAWAYHSVRAGRPVACLGLSRQGPVEVQTVLGLNTVHWVTDESSHRRFWRDAISLIGDNEEALESLSSHAYPAIFFRDGVWRGLGDLDGGYLALRGRVKKYLAVLDDYGAWAFSFPPPALTPNEPMGEDPNAMPNNQIIENRFAGLGLDMAPENPNVFSNAGTRRAREVQIGSRTVYCEWHGKLEPHRNRIHIHGPVPESDGKVIVAFFHEHLPLP